MGQYYKPTNISKKECIRTWSYNNGSKLMEHSYIGNEIMDIVERLLMPKGEWYKDKIVWAGDYADEETIGQGNLYRLIEKEIKPVLKKADKKYHFIVNHTLKQYVDKDKIKQISKSDDFKIHPLSLLVCEGNGRGGGDFCEEGEDDRVGSWARHSISVEREIPSGYKEIDGQFIEKR